MSDANVTPLDGCRTGCRTGCGAAQESVYAR
ncbi:hypothetical protein BW23_6082 [Burkholderia ubonensis MSMB22]|nr:hypothetical protein BW23_6082 [Burkholderia ubonensis MSMB22]